ARRSRPHQRVHGFIHRRVVRRRRRSPPHQDRHLAFHRVALRQLRANLGRRAAQKLFVDLGQLERHHHGPRPQHRLDGFQCFPNAMRRPVKKEGGGAFPPPFHPPGPASPACAAETRRTGTSRLATPKPPAPPAPPKPPAPFAPRCHFRWPPSPAGTPGRLPAASPRPTPAQSPPRRGGAPPTPPPAPVRYVRGS